MQNSGYILEIIDGAYVGNFAIAYHKQQMPELQKEKKLLVQVFEDELCEKPIFKDGKPILIIKGIKKFKRLGFVD